MDNSGSGSFMRNRRLESFLNTSSSPTYREKPKVSVKEEAAQKPKADVYQDDDDDDGWVLALISCIRIVTCFLTMMVTTFIWALIMLVLLPWPYERIRQGNIYGHVTGRLLMWILGNPRKIEGSEFSNKRAIYICNHASPLDIFLIMWLTPTGTVGIAKKEIMWYPLFGQLYILANHLRIDRSNPTAAIQSLKEAADAVVRNNLSLIIFPEGTRSRNGRLLPFKKGFVHLALQSGLPIVPMVFTGTHLAWRKGSSHVRPAPLTVRYLDPIITDDWTADKIDEYVKMVHNLYVKHLPESQRPPES
ncbi:1-acyl-sn-glycerol-3-phosphate acyltransferase-like isoform X1 [Ziziphus jujuba]|uniref:1-acyl-sn-glycerol-3-phosphate acyltransferase n=1 Tax=Ziziphus jujuba TaxID=326968 RepID=A0A6P4AKN4_ZIZJJ|nr:1-acyl-sn-glycerol-3-phosphate acyltransferase isoform X1 [Ziziphus jujuba]XP_015898409.3 1-acyl-sn-glycerol-3-phosphate acyltransferase isoform X1 [Ziziphus jujuba]XP_024929034.3 1-acyl-sn-glycerol-3-phosphate acyltransferase isoform X1 [Ziziphus jujuba]XP_060672108.1 1-acyl-sn-glycerol-3-phosphate acyltransferase-like isoform X1 [Ziziphus jujuba]XP_060672111.1 1-acyl-sn-glycerol-3-phosphate acyltransferase-like isoform X1 [Ziziphus jujuba]XP_060672114.1 1-acyl-sn-glycerol-3-phosphate acyl